MSLLKKLRERRKTLLEMESRGLLSHEEKGFLQEVGILKTGGENSGKRGYRRGHSGK